MAKNRSPKWAVRKYNRTVDMYGAGKSRHASTYRCHRREFIRNDPTLNFDSFSAFYYRHGLGVANDM